MLTSLNVSRCVRRFFARTPAIAGRQSSVALRRSQLGVDANFDV